MTSLVLAKEQLGLSPDAPDTSVPISYLKELKLHLSLYPEDSNFRIFIEPRRGFGKVKCLETGCSGLEIPLNRRTRIADDGKRDGFGSFAKYRMHIENHPTHIANRQARLHANASISGASAKTGKRVGSLLSGLGSMSTPSTPTRTNSVKKEEEKPVPQPLGRRKSSSSLARIHGQSSSHNPSPQNRLQSLNFGSTIVKPEPVETVIPRKRTSDVFNSHTKPDAKRTKTEPSSPEKAPLALVNKNTGSSQASPVRKSLTAFSTAATQTMLQERMNNVQFQLNELLSKPAPTSADAVQIDTLLEENSTLQAQLETFQKRAILNAPGPSNSKSAIKSELIPDSFTHPGFGASSRSVPKNVKSEPVSASFTHPSFAERSPVASGSGSKYKNLPVKAEPRFFPRRKAFSSPAPDSEAETELESDADYDIDAAQARADAIVARLTNNGVIPNIVPIISDNHDENGDFHGRGRDTFAGPSASPQDINVFLLSAGNAEQFDSNASVEQAVEKLGLASQYDKIDGMQVALMPHQTIGVAWMVEKELGSNVKAGLKGNGISGNVKASNEKGGILADDMGLGKTVQMIATMCKNRSTNPRCKTTLICCPTALLSQWKLEIETKTNNLFKVLIYHGSSKLKHKTEVMKYDVVVTTYSTMALEWPDLEQQQKDKMKAKQKRKATNAFIASSEDDSDVGLSANKRKQKQKKNAGILFQIDFFRLVLDEAQCIRNRRTRTSRAVTALRSTFRWCLTGTPIINSVLDAYGLMRFLQVRPWYDFSEFQGHIGRLEKMNPNLAVTRLQAIFQVILLRRMKDTMLDGKRLIELPPKNVALLKLDFSFEEREIYAMVEARTQATFNRYLRAGTVLKNYSQVLVLLLRLRQICSHPSLIAEDGVAFIAPDEDDESATPESRAELARARRVVSPEFVIKMKSKLKEATLKRIADEKASAEATVEDEDCPVCFDTFTDAVITSCGHTFCRDCVVDFLNQPRLHDGGNDDAPRLGALERPCPVCRTPITQEKCFTRAAFEPTNAELNGCEEQVPEEDVIVIDDSDVEMVDVKPKLIKGKKPSKKVVAKRARRSRVWDSEVEEISQDDQEDDDDMSDFIVEDDEDEEEKDNRRRMKTRLGKCRAIIVDSDEEDEIQDPEESEIIFGRKLKAKISPEQIKLMPRFLPSTKMKYMMDYLKRLAQSAPEEKTMVISQWTSCLSLVSDYLSEAGIVHVKYTGSMTRPQRDKSIVNFMLKDRAMVMLMSLKCGGVGLNLTRANHVINLDLGWSQAVEAQAFDRVHRLGQLLPVTVERLVINNTVEDRVLAMQERKQNLADGSLGEGAGKKIGRLSVKELANLFGLDVRGRVL